MTVMMAILNDTTRCTGCEECVAACKRENKLPKDRPRRWQRRIDDLSATRFTTLKRVSRNRFMREQCRHCVDPACVSACLVGAMQKTPEGPVIYDDKKCMGCRYCMVACPYEVPRYEWASPVPYVRKCTMCYPRVRQGKPPACVEACPQGATIFGPRDKLLAEARRRIASEPDRYRNVVLGETEVGGTCVLYLSDLTLPTPAHQRPAGEKPLPDLTWAALSKVPFMVLGVGGAMAGLWWITGRRERLAREAQQASGAGQDEAQASSPAPAAGGEGDGEASSGQDQEAPAAPKTETKP